MNPISRSATAVAVKTAISISAIALAFITCSAVSLGQTATLEGSLSSFDVVNDSGRDVHGFEIQIEGAVPGDLYYTVPGQRYGNPVVTPYATGVRIRYSSPYNASTRTYTQTTPQHTPGTPFSWNDCYQLGSRYSVSGCEHFGQSMRATQPGQITKITGSWLVDNPATPGTLVPLDPPAVIPFALWTVVPPTVFAAPPVVVAEVEAPEPPETPETYGDAQWVKIFKTQLTRTVTANELNSDNPTVVPEDPSQVEVTWDVLQADPPSGGKGNRSRTRTRNQGGIAASTRSVIRRYELYKYTGAYDPINHKVVCADGTCTAPSTGELGGPISAQNTAANVLADTLNVTKSGAGTVGGANGKISCGNLCATFAPAGTAQTLTATPGGRGFLRALVDDGWRRLATLLWAASSARRR